MCPCSSPLQPQLCAPGLQSFPDFGDLLKLDPVVGLPQHDVTIGRHSGRRMHGLEFPDILPVFYIAVIRPADSAFIHRRSMEHEVAGPVRIVAPTQSPHCVVTLWSSHE